jgi:Uma2 family endonuclease
MGAVLLQEPPLTFPSDLGPYRREDYAQLPDEPRCELIFGRFHVRPSPSVLHQIVVGLLFEILNRFADAMGGLALLSPLDVILADHSVVQPDLVYISAERRTIVQDRIEGVPDFLIEIFSPGTARRDRGEKLALYLASGVREYWIVDPIERQIEFLTERDGRFSVALPVGAEYRSEVLPEVRLNLATLWRKVDEKLGKAAQP